MTLREWIAAAFLAVGGFWFFSATLGLFRFRTTLPRMHAASLGDTMGLLFLLLGAMVLRGVSIAAVKMLLVAVFFWITGPTLTHLLAKVEVLYHGNMYQEYREEERK